jgi:cytochrome oxidase Cu insertion factor (SCO1/SenC/PrrC family)
MRGRLLMVILAGFLIGALGGAAALILTSSGQGPKVQTTGTPYIGGPFTLVDQNGNTVTTAISAEGTC